MKDILGREIKVGQYIAYGLIAGRSANLAIYQVKETRDDCLKVIKIVETYGDFSPDREERPIRTVPRRHMKFIWNEETQTGKCVECTPEEKSKIDNKVTTIKMTERAIILDEFTPAALGEKD